MAQENDLKEFLLVTSSRLESHREFLKIHEVELSPFFNSFDFIRPDENRLSDIIVSLLDPNGKHGQRDVFLKIFLKNIGLDKKFTNLNEVSILREESTEEYRRIDITIKQNNVFGIGIENKPWAKDQFRQLSDYIKYMREEFNDNFLFLYLSPHGEEPSEDSIKQEEDKDSYKDKLKIISYSDIYKWVKSCRDICQSDRVRAFLKDFELYLQQEFEGGQIMLEKEIIIKQVLSNIKNLEAALLVSINIFEIKGRLLEKLKNDIENELKKRNSDLILDWQLKYWEKFSYFSFKKAGWNNHTIRFEQDCSELNGVGYGICKNNENIPDNPSIMECLGNGDKSIWWQWCIYFDPYRDWRNSPQPWIDILTGNMAEKVINIADDLCKKLEKRPIRL